MQYRITYLAASEAPIETIIVSHMLALHALIDYANKWQAAIVSVEERASRRGKWTPTTITQND